MIGSYIEAKDGDIGHVEDFIIDDTAWAVRYMIVDTVNWLPGKKVLVSPRWIQSMKWGGQESPPGSYERTDQEFAGIRAWGHTP